MELNTKKILKVIKLNENIITMVLGALVVLVVGFILFNTFRNRDAQPQITQQAAQTQTPQEGQVPQGVGGTYKVAKGDTLWSIAEANYGSGYNWTDIAEANKLSNPGSIEEGQELTLPEVAAKAQTATQQVVQAQPTISPPSPTLPTTISSESYTVVPGDHLWGIAVRAYGDGYQWVKIWHANKATIANHPDLIFVGQTLTIPREATK